MSRCSFIFWARRLSDNGRKYTRHENNEMRKGGVNGPYFCSAYRFIEMMPHRVCKCSDGVVKNEQIFVLVLAEREHQCVQDDSQVGNQLRAGLLLQSGKGTKKKARKRTSICLRYISTTFETLQRDKSRSFIRVPTLF